MAAILGCVPPELNVSPAPGRLCPCGLNTACPAQKPQYFGPCSFLFHPFSPHLPQLCVCLISSFAFLPHVQLSPRLSSAWSHHGLGMPMDQWGGMLSTAQHPSTGLTGKSGRLACKSQEFFCTLLSCLRLLAGCNPCCPPLLCQAFAGSDSCPATELHAGECEGSWADNAGKPTLDLQGPKQR